MLIRCFASEGQVLQNLVHLLYRSAMVALVYRSGQKPDGESLEIRLEYGTVSLSPPFLLAVRQVLGEEDPPASARRSLPGHMPGGDLSSGHGLPKDAKAASVWGGGHPR